MTDQEYFCAAAWTALYLDTDGTVDFCCIGRNKLGNIREKSVQEILESDHVRNIRASMLRNEPVAGCESCWRQTKEHRLQNFFNTKYVLQEPIGRARDPDPALTTQFYSDISASRIKYLDLRWNNTCNFACIYCGDKYSSLWAEQSQKNQLNLQLTTKPAKSDKRTVFDFLDQALDTVDWIYFAGGEPLAIKENVEILDTLLETNPDCVLQINTNLSLLDNNPVFERLQKFPGVRWMISGEAMGSMFEYVRWPGKWDIFSENLRKIGQLREQGHQITFNLVAMNINHLSIWDYLDYLLDLDLVDKPTDINLNIYNSRDSRQPFAIQRMPDAWRDQCRERIGRNRYEVDGVTNYLAALDDPIPDNTSGWSGLELTAARLRSLDQLRALDSRSIFPHVYEYIENQPKM